MKIENNTSYVQFKRDHISVGKRDGEAADLQLFQMTAEDWLKFEKWYKKHAKDFRKQAVREAQFRKKIAKKEVKPIGEEKIDPLVIN